MRHGPVTGSRHGPRDRSVAGGQRNPSKPSPADSGSHAEVLELQRLAGNQAVTHAIQRVGPRAHSVEYWQQLRDQAKAGDPNYDLAGNQRLADELSEAVEVDQKKKGVGDAKPQTVPIKPGLMYSESRTAGKPELRKPAHNYGTETSRFRAANLLSIAGDEKDAVVGDIEGAARDLRGEFQQLEHAIKGHDSLSRKMASTDKNDTVALDQKPEWIDSMGDVLRFTIKFDPADDKELKANVGERIAKVFTALTKKAYTQTDHKDTLSKKGVAYRGLNTNWRTKSGYRFELQFHTPESIATKGTIHHAYEASRVLDKSDPSEGAERAFLEAHSTFVSNQLEAPSGLKNLSPAWQGVNAKNAAKNPLDPFAGHGNDNVRLAQMLAEEIDDDDVKAKREESRRMKQAYDLAAEAGLL